MKLDIKQVKVRYPYLLVQTIPDEQVKKDQLVLPPGSFALVKILQDSCSFDTNTVIVHRDVLDDDNKLTDPDIYVISESKVIGMIRDNSDKF